jgi:nuclear pore complex protein Nup133
MFSPVNNAPQSTTARSSRRRPRPASSDSISQPKAKRQRSALSEQTFLSPDVAPEMEEANKSTVAVVRRESTKLVHTPRRDLTVRGKKPKSAERATSKGDGSVILVRQFLAALVTKLRN